MRPLSTLRISGKPNRRIQTIASFGDPIARAGTTKTESLPFTAEEVRIAAEIFGEGAMTFTGEAANESAVRALAHKVDVLHFACHGFTDINEPLNSGLILSGPQGWQESRDNGILQGREILEGERLNADLVILSACETAVGNNVAGEGLIGLSRIFHYAGARSLLGTIWRIPDRSTSELVGHFLRAYKDGTNKEDALRTAQLHFINGPEETRHPFFWAGFQLYGP